jgi:CTP:molybdopterin cytidylyltransferase MocA
MLLALVDQPMVTADIIDQLIDAYEKGDRKIVVPLCEGQHGHPLILSRELSDDIMLLDDDSSDGFVPSSTLTGAKYSKYRSRRLP